MITLFLGLALIALALVALALQRYYSSVPVRELKRLSKRGDHLAQALYRPAAYGASLRVLLWLIVGALLPYGFLLAVPQVPVYVGFLLMALSLFIAFVWIPSLRLTIHAAQFAAFMSPLLTAIVRQVHPALSGVAGLVNRMREFSMHSRLYEKEDLTDLLSKQKDQPDNRISLEDLELTHRALQFSDKHAGDIVQTRKSTLLVDSDDSIGPILLDQLHKSGQSTFLVYKDDEENIVGSLLMRDAINAREGGRVFDLVRGDLCFVHEDYSLRQVLAAFQKTGHHTAVVINSFEEFVGIISLDRLVEELVGEAAVDTTENFENRSAVAAYQPQLQGQSLENEKDGEIGVASPEATEVVK
jgi:CBS domain containing-hemolysin-like protein